MLKFAADLSEGTYTLVYPLVTVNFLAAMWKRVYHTFIRVCIYNSVDLMLSILVSQLFA